MKTTEGKYKMDGVMSENGFPAPGKAELRNIFAASCVESAADHEGISAAEMFVRMEAVNLFSELIYPCYETLHTQSRQIVTEDILEALHRREAKKGDLNESVSRWN